MTIQRAYLGPLPGAYFLQPFRETPPRSFRSACGVFYFPCPWYLTLVNLRACQAVFLIRDTLSRIPRWRVFRAPPPGGRIFRPLKSTTNFSSGTPFRARTRVQGKRGK